jgi:hypothetical protein
MPFLSDTITRIRLLADEPSSSAKYSDSDIIRFIETDWSIINRELARLADNPILSRATITLDGTIQVYQLPPVIDRVIRIGEVRDNNTFKALYQTGGAWSPFSRGIALEGKTLKLDPNYEGESRTLVIDYVASGAVRLHYGTCTIDTANSDTTETVLVLGATPTAGTLDQRAHAYVGQTLRILADTPSDVYEQESPCTAYDVTTRKLTVQPALDNDLLTSGYTGATSFNYEIAPPLGVVDAEVIAYGVAMRMMSTEGDNRRNAYREEYNRLMRELRLTASTYDTLSGNTFRPDSVLNPRFMSNWIC